MSFLRIEDKWNVPGSIDYDPSKPVDVVLRSFEDSELRGYWLARDKDGTLCLVINDSNADGVSYTLGDDNQTPQVVIDGTPTEFDYDGVETIRIKRYS